MDLAKRCCPECEPVCGSFHTFEPPKGVPSSLPHFEQNKGRAAFRHVHNRKGCLGAGRNSGDRENGSSLYEFVEERRALDDKPFLKPESRASR
jgi:hypothetical protein